MNVRLLTLELNPKENITVLVSGEGTYVCYIMGPGSFYLSSMAKLNEHITFITCDALWARYKSDPIDEAAIRLTTQTTILACEQLIIKAIKSHFGCSKIGLFGFSAPAALAFKYALEHPEDIACVVGTGAGLCKLDPSFSATDKVFREKAPQIKIQQFDKAFQNYQKLQKSEKDGDPLPRSNFVWDSQKRQRRLTPNSDYLEQIRFLIAKMIFDEKYKEDCFEHWDHNPIGQVVCQPMREHFFNTIQPTLDTLELLDALEKQGKVPVLLEHGENDFITPVDKKTAEKLTSYAHIKLKLHQECGHLIYIEKTINYTQEVLAFIREYMPTKLIKYKTKFKQKLLEDDTQEKETTKATTVSSSHDNNNLLILRSKL
ncbi:MAG: hypothetical protein K0R24_576 [Gammaproteobacteria bacterium]|jgi:pimeloyl-ACP methyl ester carboxylesterase|nr:hypothetical protein [Gammaproteobacteria bacterium]